MLGFKGIEFRLMPQSKPDIIEAFDQTEAAERIDLKLCFKTAAIGDRLLLKRHREFISRNRLCALEQFRNVVFT